MNFNDQLAAVATINIPFQEGCGRTKPGRRKGAPVVRPAGFSSVTPYVVRQVTRLTRSFSASFDSSSLACSSLHPERTCMNIHWTHSRNKQNVSWGSEVQSCTWAWDRRGRHNPGTFENRPAGSVTHHWSPWGSRRGRRTSPQSPVGTDHRTAACSEHMCPGIPSLWMEGGLRQKGLTERTKRISDVWQMCDRMYGNLISIHSVTHLKSIQDPKYTKSIQDVLLFLLISLTRENIVLSQFKAVCIIGKFRKHQLHWLVHTLIRLKS